MKKGKTNKKKKNGKSRAKKKEITTKTKKKITKGRTVKKTASKKKIFKKKTTKVATKKKNITKTKKINKEAIKRFISKNKQEREGINAEIKKTVIAEDLMLRNPIYLDENSTIHDAIELLDKYNLKSVIITREKKPIGYVDEEDILKFLSDKINLDKLDSKSTMGILNKPIKEVIREYKFVAKKTTPVKDVISAMNKEKINQIPVVDKNVVLIGAILDENILDYIKYTSEDKITKEEVVKTGIDKLLELVESNKEISTKEAAEKLGMKLQEVEKFARILQSHGLIDIDFSTIGVIKLRKKENEIF
jgi:CBS domain-containing protein